MPKSTSWLWPVMSLLSLKMGLRRTALRRETAPTELWTMRKMVSRILTLSSTSCCSLRRSTSWWHSPTGIGRFHAVGDLYKSVFVLYICYFIGFVHNKFKVAQSSIVRDVTFALDFLPHMWGLGPNKTRFVFLLRYIIWIEATSPLCVYPQPWLQVWGHHQQVAVCVGEDLLQLDLHRTLCVDIGGSTGPGQ